MKKKAIIAIVSLIVFGQGAWAQTTPNGSWSDYKAKSFSTTGTNSITITSEAELALLAYNVNNEIEDYEDYTITLNKDLDLGAHYWVPIGMEKFNGTSTLIDDKAFKGTFDGGSHSISGVYVDSPEIGGVGLFGFLFVPAIVKNIKLTSGDFTGDYCVGAIAGEYSGATNHNNYGIYNCEVGEVSVTAVSNNFGLYAGGIIGDLAQATAENCTSAATVVGNDYVGGIAGHISKSGTYVGTLTNCYFTGNTKSAGGSEAMYVGKIVGLNGDLDDNGIPISGSPGTLSISLLDDDSNATVKNSTRIANYHNQIATVTLSGRTLYKDNRWNTICLPFKVVDGNTEDLITFTGTPFEGAIVKKLDIDGWYGEDDKCYTKDGVNYIDANNEVFSGDISTLKQTGIEGYCLYLNFAEATSIVAGVPYLIKWASGDHITDPEFTNVTINANASTEVSFTGGGSFVGTYNAKRFTTADLGQYLIMGGDNTLYYTKADAGIGACRAYFQVPEGSASIKMFNLNFSDYSTTTKITNTNLADQTYEDGEWWTLSGMKLNGKPSEKGVYLFNGKKVVIQ